MGLPYDTFKDISFITQIGNVSGVPVAHPSFEPSTVEALIAAAKAAPGAISYASLGVGTAAHITAELLKVRRGINMVHVPYSGSSAAFRNHMLPLTVDSGTAERLADIAANGEGFELDMGAMALHLPDGQHLTFTLPRFRQAMLLEGRDEVEVTVSRLPTIEAYRARVASSRPWELLLAGG